MNNSTIDVPFDPLPIWSIIVYDILMGVIMIVGVAGNGIVLLVESFNKHMTSTDWLVVTLSANDLLIVGFNIPVYISFYSGTWEYVGSDVLCKLNTFIQDSFGYCATLLLSVTAIDRYIKTCRPHSRGITTRRAKWICFVVVVATVIIGAPILFTFRFHEVYMCKYVASAVVQKYIDGLVLFIQLTFLAMFLIVIICYSKIAHVLRHKLMRTGVTMDAASNTGVSGSVCPSSGNHTAVLVSGSGITKTTYVSEQKTSGEADKSVLDNNHHLTVPVPGIASHASATTSNHPVKVDHKAENSLPELTNTGKGFNACSKTGKHLDKETHKCTKDRVPQPRAKEARQTQTNLQQQKVNRTTLIMFAVTLVFLLSWIPPWIIAATWRFDTTVMSERITTMFLRRIFIINTVTNPLFYIGMSSNFRTLTRTVLKKIWDRFRCRS